ncbi:sensor histidine kinase [Pedobacter sp. UBA5917]|jgi:signal transduction histidine kinase|uniref:sensor histidine kinase n=1 Tax=Pedobacter sp. UBA5917 TaxID=1947061 RepID=UPI0025D60C85|nr:HAMP domain-containing sensor histidine kinase [Pedobacter sp. UBA5917]
MRLLTKSNLNYIWLTVSVLLLSGFLLYRFLYIEISEEIKEQLELQENMVTSELKKGSAVHFPLVVVKEIDQNTALNVPVFKDTLIYDHIQRKSEGYYLLRQSRKIKNKIYSIQVMTTYIGWGHYSRAILFIFLFIAIMLIVVGAVMNYVLNRAIWNPMKINLKRLKNYSVSSDRALLLEHSNIDEFKELNQVIIELATRAKGEYNTLKEFTENASHEIQTPLSIIQGKLDRMSQIDQSNEMTNIISDAKSAVNRLTKVNKGLLLLAKLENGGFPDESNLELSHLLLRQIEQVEDLIDHKEIRLNTEIKPKTLTASSSLMEILISNFLSNMISHSPKGANAKIILLQDKISFINSGNVLSFDKSKLFNRFGKNIMGKTGNGLGLPIVKQICLLYDWNLSYHYTNGEHIFEITF